STMAVHALVDFPFYIPICLLLYGTTVGLLDTLASGAVIGVAQPTVLRRAVFAGGAALAAWLLVMPAAAEAAAWVAHRRWREARAESAASWFELARRLAPHDWRYHWYAGQFWFGQAQAGAGGSAARQADRAYAAGDAANPREVANLLGRITIHRRL